MEHIFDYKRIKFYFKKTFIGLRHFKGFTCSYPGTNT